MQRCGSGRSFRGEKAAGGVKRRPRTRNPTGNPRPLRAPRCDCRVRPIVSGSFLGGSSRGDRVGVPARGWHRAHGGAGARSRHGHRRCLSAGSSLPSGVVRRRSRIDHEALEDGGGDAPLEVSRCLLARSPDRLFPWEVIDRARVTATNRGLHASLGNPAGGLGFAGRERCLKMQSLFEGRHPSPGKHRVRDLPGRIASPDCDFPADYEKIFKPRNLPGAGRERVRIE